MNPTFDEVNNRKKKSFIPKPAPSSMQSSIENK